VSTAFKLVGAKAFPVSSPQEAREKLRRVLEGEYKVVVLTEEVASMVKDERRRIAASGEVVPVFVVVPSFKGHENLRLKELHDLISQAVGAKLKLEGSK